MLTIIIDKEDYKILKDLTERTFTKSKKKRTRREKSPVIRLWRAKGKISHTRQTIL